MKRKINLPKVAIPKVKLTFTQRLIIILIVIIICYIVATLIHSEELKNHPIGGLVAVGIDRMLHRD